MIRGPRSLRSLTLAFLLTFLVVVAATGYGTYAATRTTIVRLVDRRIAAAADTVTGEAPRPDDAAMLRRIAVLRNHRDTGDIGFLLIGRDGRRLGGNLAMRGPPPPGFSSLHRQDGIAGLTHGRAFVERWPDGGALVTVAETEPFDDYHSARVRIYLVGFGSIVLVVMAGMIGFGLLVARRIAATRRTARAIIDGDLRQRVPLAGDGGVFDAQAATFNLMLDRITELMRGLTEVSNDIAHDLRTPLARLRGRLARLERDADDPALRDGLADAIAQSDALLAMFAAMLRIAEVEGGDRRAAFAPIDLGMLVDEIGTMMAPVAEESGHALSVERPAWPIPIVGDRQLLTQALINLIENARRHSPAGTRIVVAVDSAMDARLSVADDGPGIAVADRAQALRRFGRLEASRSRAGHGLGLPLVDAIARLHRGTLALEDAAPGLRAVLALPLAPGAVR